MNTKLLMTVSALLMGAAGILLSFLPDETASLLGLPGENTIVMQLIGAQLFGFAMLNWMAKANLIGGIYSRPVAIGNWAHFFIGALALIKWGASASPTPAAIAVTVAYALLAALFGYVLFTHPVAAVKT